MNKTEMSEDLHVLHHVIALYALEHHVMDCCASRTQENGNYAYYVTTCLVTLSQKILLIT